MLRADNVPQRYKGTATTRRPYQQKAGFYVQKGSPWTKNKHVESKNGNNVKGPIMYHSVGKEPPRIKTTRSPWQQKAGFYVQKASPWTKNKHAELKRQQCYGADNVPQCYKGTTTYQNYQESMATKSRLLYAERVALNHK